MILESLKQYIIRLNRIKFIMVWVLLLFVPQCLIAVLVYFFGNISIIESVLHKQNLSVIDLLFVIALAPIYETLIFQGFLIDTTAKYTKNNYTIPVLLSSFLFGLSHFYSVGYILYTFLCGILLALARIVKIEKKYALTNVIIIHSIKNAIGVIVGLLIDK
jgi:uncharacterized protein